MLTTSEIYLPEKKIYLKPFLENLYTRNDGFSLNFRRQIDSLLAQLVKFPPRDYVPTPPSKHAENVIVLPIPPCVQHNDPQYRFYLSKQAQRVLISFILRKFYFVFFAHMRAYSYMKLEWAVNAFIVIWDLPPSSSDMLKKAYYRYRQKRKERLENSYL